MFLGKFNCLHEWNSPLENEPHDKPGYVFTQKPWCVVSHQIKKCGSRDPRSVHATMVEKMPHTPCCEIICNYYLIFSYRTRAAKPGENSTKVRCCGNRPPLLSCETAMSISHLNFPTSCIVKPLCMLIRVTDYSTSNNEINTLRVTRTVFFLIIGRVLLYARGFIRIPILIFFRGHAVFVKSLVRTLIKTEIMKTNR